MARTYNRDELGRFSKQGGDSHEKNIMELRADIPELSRKLKESVFTIQKWAALQFFRYVVGANGAPSHPVDTGYSRAQWQIGIGSPNFAVAPRPAANLRLTTTYPAPQIPDIANPDGQPIFITNSVDYVKYLEEGTSTQAPNGFVKIAIAKTIADLGNMASKA